MREKIFEKRFVFRRGIMAGLRQDRIDAEVSALFIYFAKSTKSVKNPQLKLY